MMETYEEKNNSEDSYADLKKRYGIADIADWGEFVRTIKYYYTEEDAALKKRLADWLTEEGTRPVHGMDNFRSDLESGRLQWMAGAPTPEAAKKEAEHTKRNSGLHNTREAV